MVSNIVIVGGKNANPAVLKTTLDPVQLNQPVIALKSIGYGDLSSFYTRFQYKSKEFCLPIKPQSPGRSFDHAQYVADQINLVIDEVAILVGEETRGISFICSKSINIISLPSFLKATKEDARTWLIEDETITKTKLEDPLDTELCFVYCNIVVGSYLNGKRSRILAVVPVTHHEKGYVFHEFSTPTYVPIEVREFSKVEIVLRNIKGELLPLSSKFDCMVNLHVRDL